MKLSSLTQKHRLLKINPGSYFKLASNEMKTIRSSTTGLIVDCYTSQMRGTSIYDVALVQGELLLIPAIEK